VWQESGEHDHRGQAAPGRRGGRGPSAWTAWAPAIRWSCWITTRLRLDALRRVPAERLGSLRVHRKPVLSHHHGGPHTLYAVGYSNGTVYRSADIAINVSEASPPVVLELSPYGDNASVLPLKSTTGYSTLRPEGARSASPAGYWMPVASPSRAPRSLPRTTWSRTGATPPRTLTARSSSAS